MLALIPQTYGNRRPDTFGNVHVLTDGWGKMVFRHPGDYVGRHRRPESPWPLPLLAPLIYFLGGR